MMIIILFSINKSITKITDLTVPPFQVFAYDILNWCHERAFANTIYFGKLKTR